MKELWTDEDELGYQIGDMNGEWGPDEEDSNTGEPPPPKPPEPDQFICPLDYGIRGDLNYILSVHNIQPKPNDRDTDAPEPETDHNPT